MFRRPTALVARQRFTPCAHRTSCRSLCNTEPVFEHEVEEDLSWMTTYATFDPCSFRPLPPPMQSGIAVQMPTALSGSTTSAMERDVENTNKVKKEEVSFKPWPCSLPSFLQPKYGTTFSLVNGTPTTQTKRTGVLQAILYGIPDPERFSYKRELVAPGSLLHKILYGVEEMDDGVDGDVVAAASGTAAEIDGEAITEDNTGKEAKVLVVKNVKVKIEAENVMEKKKR